MNANKKGRPYDFPKSLILFLIRLKNVFKIDYRTLEGVGRKLIVFIPSIASAPDYTTIHSAPDYTTIHSRLKGLNVKLNVYKQTEEQEIAGDSTGLKTSNRGEYRMNKHRGKRKTFVKLHISVNVKTRQVVGCSVTKEETRDGAELSNIVSQAGEYGKITKGFFDKGYDAKKNYWLLKKENIEPVIKPRETMKCPVEVEKKMKLLKEKLKTVKDPPEEESLKAEFLRLSILKKYLTNKEKWRDETGYGQRWKSEGRYSVFKGFFGEHVYSKNMDNIQKEILLKVNLMNQFATLTLDAFST